MFGGLVKACKLRVTRIVLVCVSVVGLCAAASRSSLTVLGDLDVIDSNTGGNLFHVGADGITGLPRVEVGTKRSYKNDFGSDFVLFWRDSGREDSYTSPPISFERPFKKRPLLTASLTGFTVLGVESGKYPQVVTLDIQASLPDKPNAKGEFDHFVLHFTSSKKHLNDWSQVSVSYVAIGE